VNAAATDAALCQAWRLSRDQASLAELYRRYSPKLRYVAVRNAQNAPIGLDSDDMFQEGVIALLKEADVFEDGHGTTFWTRLYLRAHGAMVDASRAWTCRGKRHDYCRIDLSKAPEPLIDPVLPDDGWCEVEPALNRLPKAQRDCLTEFYANGKTQEEIGQKLGLTYSAVSLRLKAAREAFAKAYKGEQ
jgi:RNA polymerase sigma factor (sigma-70 family)